MSTEDFEIDGATHESERTYDAARAESDLAYIAKKRREIEWWQHNIDAAEKKIAKAEERVKSFAIQYRMEVGGSQISLANGFVEVKKQREHTDIYDRIAFNRWAHAGRSWPEEFYDKKLNESKVKSVLTIEDDGTFIYEGGLTGQTIAGQRVVEVVPGIRRVKPGPLDFNVKINAGRNFEPGVVTWDEHTSDGRTIPGHHDTEETDDAIEE